MIINIVIIIYHNNIYYIIIYNVTNMMDKLVYFFSGIEDRSL